MGHEKVSTLRTEHHLDVGKHACEELDAHSKLECSCKPICSFSKKEYNVWDMEQRSKSRAKLFKLIGFYVMVMSVEIIGGLKANSLAVLSDASHLLVDIIGFSISLFALWASGWKATSQHSFGFNRLEVLGALLSVQLIWLISGILIYEALDRILHGIGKVNGILMFEVAAFGFFINLIMALWLGHDHSHHARVCKDHDHETKVLCTTNKEESMDLVPQSMVPAENLNINIQGAFLHLIADLVQSFGVMIAGIIIWAKPNWLVADLVCTLIFSTFALFTTLPMIRNTFSILMERTPNDIDTAHLESGLKCIKGLADVHDLHVWAITIGKVVLACHVLIEPKVNSNEVLREVREYCEKTYGIHHVTIQIEQA